MDAERWKAVDAWFANQLHTADDVLEQTLTATDAAELPSISVSRNLGKFLEILARSIGARTILEIGTLGGYSAICLARALPIDGRLITLEISSGHADVARANIANAGLSDRVEVIVGDAFESLRALDPESAPTFDLVFIDANKDGYPRYFREALRLTRPGGIIVADNVVRSGRVLDPAESGSDVAGIRGLIEIISRDPRIAATAIQTVGEKSYDGFLIARIAD